MKQHFSVSGMTCSACSAHVERAVKTLPGVEGVSVSLMTHRMEVDFDPQQLDPQAIAQAVTRAGYGAAPLEEGSPSAPPPPDPQEETQREIRDMKHRLVWSLVFLLPLMYLSMGHMVGLPLLTFLTGRENSLSFGLSQLLLTLPVLALNRRYFQGGLRSLAHGAPNMDTLIAVGSGAAVVYGIFALYQMSWGLGHGDWERVARYHMDLYFESAAMILALITLGKFLETRSKGKTSQAITRLLDLSPKTATLLREGQEVEVPVDQVQVGDLLRVRPGQAIPVDGVVVEGASAVDQSALTGESIPTEVGPGDPVSAATLNQSGSFVFRASRVGRDTTLAQMIALVEQAAASKAPIARLADRVAGVFVPVVMAIAALTALVWYFAGGHSLTQALGAGISVLVISCPCALGLATPVAILVGTGKGAEQGILVKSAQALEVLHQVDTVVLDKTGTLTQGKPEVTDVLPGPDLDEEGLLMLAASLESPSEHPLARAIVAHAAARSLPTVPVQAFLALHGRGVRGMLGDRLCMGGNQAMVEEAGLSLGKFADLAKTLAQKGKTPLFFADEHQVLGLIALADTPKPTSAQAVAAFRQLGLEVVMLTGDNRRTAQAMGEQLGVTAIQAEVLPQEKEQVIRTLQGEGKKVAMVGDGINDAPALARADVGIAIGAGTDIALDSADLVLMRSDLMDAVTALELSRATLRNIKENLFWAFFYNVLCIPLAAGLYRALGWTDWMLSPMVASAAMSLSSVCVVTNALRLRRFRSRFPSAPNPTVPPVREDDTSNKGEIQMQAVISIEGMMCPKCVAHVEQALSAVEGVASVQADLEGKKATVTLSQAVSHSVLADAVTQAGYEVVGVQ